MGPLWRSEAVEEGPPPPPQGRAWFGPDDNNETGDGSSMAAVRHRHAGDSQ
jgi:hypothetical protein